MPAAEKKRHRLTPAARRELILGGAMRVFAEHGYEAASIGEIAQEAGITPAVIYDHFSSKVALAIELLERQTEELFDTVGAALEAAPQEPEALIRAGIEAYFGYVEEHPSAWRMLFRDPPRDPEVTAAYARLNARATQGIAAFLNAGAGGALAEEEDSELVLEMFAELLKVAQNGLASWWYEHPEVPREEVVRRLLEFCWTGMERIAKRGDAG
ncbi:MAG TPA: TetR/AcrR family transcriptional regulator [Solirubrobacterales bacterium]|jgi:AcrR family transcriptional regulator|nr:TetR/AcrR family transcriptional regulator [Solirubrobacterales bacterium]